MFYTEVLCVDLASGSFPVVICSLKMCGEVWECIDVECLDEKRRLYERAVVITLTREKRLYVMEKKCIRNIMGVTQMNRVRGEDHKSVGRDKATWAEQVVLVVCGGRENGRRAIDEQFYWQVMKGQK